jgi:L-fuconolactonase
MPDFPIIDTHLHLTDVAEISYPWMRDVPRLNKTWRLSDYDRLTSGLNVEAMVFVEVDAAPKDRLVEAASVTDLARDDARLRGMVACVAMDEGDETSKALEAMRNYALLRGVRHLIQGHVGTPGWACRPAMIEGVRQLANYGLVFDICVLHSQLSDAVKLVRACPDVIFVLDHIGKPGIRAGLIDSWRDDLTRLAQLPNVMCKISGVVTEADHATWSEDNVLPYITHALNVFGQERVMFGTDWFVSELATSVARWVNLVDRAVAPMGSYFAERLWNANARRIYRL